MKDLIKEYLSDPDTPKEQLKKLTSPSLTYIQVPVLEKFLHGKT
jgi:hypothetical protein